MKISNVEKGERVALFNNIAIETSAKCNRHCHFCPNDYATRPDQLMSNQMFERIVGDLASLKYKGRVEFYIYNEPTRDKRIEMLISHTRKMLPSACLMFATNGDYMKGPKDILKFFDAGLNQMLINIYSANDSSKVKEVFDSGVKKSERRSMQIRNWVEHNKKDFQIGEHPLYTNIGPNKRTIHVSDKFGVKKDTPLNETDFESISNRAGNIGDFRKSTKEPLEKHCTKPFRFLNINWKGDAILCCNDYYGKTKMGNVEEMSLEEIWNCEKFNKYRLRLQNKNRNQFLCSGCDSNGGYYPHMVNGVTFGVKKDKEILGGGYKEF